MNETQRDNVIDDLMNTNTNLAERIELLEKVIAALKYHHGAQLYGSPSQIADAYAKLCKTEFDLNIHKETQNG